MWRVNSLLEWMIYCRRFKFYHFHRRCYAGGVGGRESESMREISIRLRGRLGLMREISIRVTGEAECVSLRQS